MSSTHETDGDDARRPGTETTGVVTVGDRCVWCGHAVMSGRHGVRTGAGTVYCVPGTPSRPAPVVGDACP